MWQAKAAKQLGRRKTSLACLTGVLAAGLGGEYDEPMSRSTAEIDVVVGLPVHEVPGAEADGSTADELRRLWIVEQVRRRRIGVGRGAELAGMPRVAFSELLADHGVPVFDLDRGDLEAEFELLRTLRS